MLWGEFKSETQAGLGHDQDRERYGAYIDKQIRLAALDLQRWVDEYCKGHSVRYTALNITPKGNAGVVTLPSGFQPEHVFLRPERSFATTGPTGSNSYASADGVDDKLLNVDLTGLPSDDMVWFEMRYRTQGEPGEYFRVNRGGPGPSSHGYLGTEGKWETVDSLWQVSHGLDNLSLGWVDSSDEFTAGDVEWITVHDAVFEPGTGYVRGNLLARYEFDEKSTGSLDGVEVIESTGNGPDGAHIGGTAGNDSNRKITVPFPVDLQQGDAVEVTIKIWIRGKKGEVVWISTDQGDTTSTTIAADNTWEYHEVTLNVASPDDCESIHLGYDSTTKVYSTIDWSELTIESGTFYEFIHFGEDEIESLYATKKLERYPWGRRSELVTGDLCRNAPGFYAYNSKYLWAHKLDQAALDAGATLRIEGHGRKLDFEDDDETPFDELATNAAALYVKYKLLKHIDKLNDGWKVQADYENERSNIIADFNAR